MKSVFAQALDMRPEQRLQWLRRQAELPDSVRDEVARLLKRADTDLPLDGPWASAPEAPAETRLLPGEILLDRFEIEAHLGSGGMGDVYRALDRDMREPNAIKTLRSHLANQPELLDRLRREVQLARRVKHENVCQLRDLHRDPQHRSGPLTFFTMELLAGETLAARIARGPMPVEEAEPIAAGIATGLEAIHAASIIHRDLKPANIFLVPGERVRPVIADFGLSFDEARPVTLTLSLFGPQAVVGTPAYMSPEHLRGEGVTQSTDVYSFGVVLFEMITGRLPFPGETPLAIALRRLQEDAPSPCEFAPGLPQNWESVILACLDRDPARRPASAGEVLEGLRGRVRFSPPRRITRRQAWGVGLAGATSLAGLASWKFLAGGFGHTPDPKAVYHFKLGEEFAKHGSPDGIRNSIDEFRQAVNIDAQYPAAWAGLADAYCVASSFGTIPSRTARQEAEQAASRALKLDSRLGKAHAAYAYALGMDLKRWRKAGASFERAISLDPKEPLVRSWYSGYLGRAGNHPQAIQMAESALALDPASFLYNYHLAAELFRGRQFDRLLSHMQSVVRLHPGEGAALWTLARAYEWLKRFPEAEAALHQSDGLPNRDGQVYYRATLDAAMGRLEEAKRLAMQIHQDWQKGKSETNSVVSVWGALKNADQVMAVLDGAFGREDETVLAAPTNPYLDFMKDDPRYRRLLREIDFG